MVALVGYEDLILIHDSNNSQVYRARRISDNQPVILKFLNREYPTSEQIRRYKQEYQLTQQLESSGIVKAYSLEEWQRSVAIVLEDFGAISLRKWLQERGPISLEEFLLLAIAITESLGQIHAQHIIHKDINPANIVLNPKTQVLKIIDFGIATQLSRENPTLKNPHVLEGTLAYISPEQTGRMNRSLDYRTDFYSLGVTFYEMLAGRLPFETEDPLEFVHAHIAKMPIALGNREKIPQIIADIVMKLMAKNAEERYQSAEGLQADLEECRRQLDETGNMTVFSLARQDFVAHFQIPQKLYGREKEIATLLAAFEEVAETGKVELMLVAGYSGMGKSSLVQELYKAITAHRGYFISGKFDQFQRNIPYSAIVAAFSSLVGQLLGESEASLQIWREKLLKALGNNGQVIVDVIPEVELIIGKQPPVPELGANETQNRFNLVFGNFIHVFCDREHPLTLFIDDLQWADFATLQLIERLLLEEPTEYLLLLGAYRDNEVSAAHPLAMSLAKLQQNKGKTIAEIILNPLPLNQVTALIGDALQQNPQAEHLARLVWQKTGGNPFFINEFLQALYDEELLQFNRQARSWQWDMAAIEARDFTDNVVELMVEKLQKLSPYSQEILSLAACWGAEFDLDFLTWVGEKSARETFELLKEGLDRGFILPLSELDEHLLIQSYKFGHDRIQQAAYALIPDDRRATTHYRIGQILLQKLPPKAREEGIFELVNQLNYGAKLINEQIERDQLAHLNLIACRKAKLATAYQAAREYASTGLSLLGVNAWQQHYEMSLAFHNLAAELAALCGELDTMEKLIETVIEQAQSLLERIHIYQIKIKANISQEKETEAITIAQQILGELGITFPEIPNQDDIKQEIAEIETLVGDREIEDLVHLPVMKDAEKIAIVEIANSVIPAAFSCGSPLLPLLITLSVKISIQYGNISASGFTYALYGSIMCNFSQNVDTGVKFSKLALQVVSKLNAKAVKSSVLNITSIMVLHRKAHIKETLPLSEEGYISGLESGDREFAGHCAGVVCLNSIWCGQYLPTLEQQARNYCNTLVQLKQLKTANHCRIYWQCALNLLGFADCPSVLSGEALQEEEFLTLNNDLSRFGLFYPHKLMLGYLFGDIESALNHALEGRAYLGTIDGVVAMPGFYFYDSLIAIAACGLGLKETSEILKRVEENQAKLQQHWAHYAPMNYQHKVDLVEAEKCRFLGRKIEAIELYNQAISGAKTNEYIHEEALANELMAKFYLDWGHETAARAYMMEARYCYSRWGATAKVRHLEENYPQLFRVSAVTSSTDDSDRISNPTRSSSNNNSDMANFSPTTNNTAIETNLSKTSDSNFGSSLDIDTIFKANRVISGQIVLDRLLVELMHIILQNAGAQTGCLIVVNEDDLVIEASGSVDSEEIVALQNQRVTESNTVCHAIVNYVARTQERLVLNNACYSGNFTRNPYIKTNQSQSILCIPLVNQGKLISMVYLENNLTVGAFTDDRVNTLQVLSGQAAIALENAYLYRNLEQKVEKRTAELALANAEIQTLNEQLTSENLRLSSEVDVARKIQQMVLPKQTELEVVENLDIAGFMEPADEVGGDYYDVLKQGDRIKISIGDVTGHGLESGVLMLMAQTVIRTLENIQETHAIHFLEIVNQTLYQNLQRMNSDKNMSLAILNYECGVIQVSGQHEEIIVVRADGQLELIDTLDLGFPIGLELEIGEFVAQQEIILNRDDIVILYTDGITEAENMENELYGLERLTQLAQQYRQYSAMQIRDLIIEEVRQFIGQQKVFDDITLVVLKQR
ncbi:MAG: AAA family ATPase [Roseofilum sp. SID3]|uniref:AAA family ATPase n=1 Tax=Roseofilum sp. SID3 TaxID=2821499 RepID=UPI001B24E330|nr:AAA family ATPase [Roseofilum sp. SID3]MBP0013452.1 AAA family ATPase [Roseofilum sp. SID3]